MLGIFGARNVDLLKELHQSLRDYVLSGSRLADYLSLYPQISACTPRHAVWLIREKYHGGVLRCHDFVPIVNTGVPAEYYLHAREAGECIAHALDEAYGPQGKTYNRSTPVPSPSAPAAETEEEKAIKKELRWVVLEKEIRDELKQLEGNFKYIATNRTVFPALNEYASLTAFERRVRPLTMAFALEALPSKQAVERVTLFLKTLYREADHALVKLADKEAGKK